jgi:hypothetical protein
MLNVEVPGLNWSARFSVTLPAVAVSVAVCAVLTAATDAVNPLLVEPAGTVTVAGNATAALLLARLTVSPPLWAAAVSVNVQASFPDPEKDTLLHERAVSAGIGLPGLPVVPVPPRLTAAVAPVDELLLMVS